MHRVLRSPSLRRSIYRLESGHSCATPLYARAPRDERAYGHVPRNHTRNTTPVAALTPTGLDAPMVPEGAMDRGAFVAWLRHSLVPTPTVGQVIVMDNLDVHKGGEVRAVIEGAYSKVKTRVRRAAKRTQPAVEAAIGDAVGAVTAQDAAGWFRHCSYHPAGQHL